MRSPVPDLIHGLRCLSSILSKAESHCANRKIDPDALLKARLYPDMFHLTRNVTTACDSAKFTAARLSQTEPPRYEDNEASFAELQGRIAKTIAFLETIPDAAFAAAETRELAVPLAPEGPGGLVIISTVDSPFYEGAFKMNEAARKAGFAAPTIYTFDAKDYPGYTHQNTANEESAADGHTAFATFVFSG
jgi:hypothetical protein